MLQGSSGKLHSNCRSKQEQLWNETRFLRASSCHVLKTSRTDSVNNLSPCFPVHMERKFLMVSRVPFSVLVPKAMSSPASHGCSDSAQRATASGPNHLGEFTLCWIYFSHMKNLRYLIKVDAASLNVLKALGRACLTSRNNCKFLFPKKKKKKKSSEI